MAVKDTQIAKVGKITLYRRNGDTIFLKWYDAKSGKRGNYRRLSAKTSDMRRALALAADVNEGIEQGLPEPGKIAMGPTVMDAMLQHPASKREASDYPGDHRRHVAAVHDFATFSGSKLMRDLTVEKICTWIADLDKRGMAFDTRRHCLIPLRRASQMAPGHGLNDVLGGMRLDRQTEAIEVKALGLDGLKKLVAHASAHEDLRWAAAILLMGACGLRPSEVIRLRVSDLKDGLLHVGSETAKNASSNRILPIPQIVIEALAPLVMDKAADENLLGLRGTEAGRASVLSRSVKAVLVRAGFNLPPKSLRKTFATVCLNELGLEPAIVESYLGHTHPGATGVTNRHYLKRAGAESLRPVAEAMDRALGVTSE